ncbi:twin-arginine translocation signal domain-containing protein, partial [Vibrio parahaemolyticus]|nr:twin-arginine translocation signal domain-containing protein [Vibrio parahaemolyticus]
MSMDRPRGYPAEPRRVAGASEGPGLPIEPCDGNLKLGKTFSGCMPEYCLVGQQDMGSGQIMIRDGRTVDAGATDEEALLGRRPALLTRRSFLVGSAVGVGALGLAGCATSDGMSLAEAAKLYGPVPDEKFPIPAVDISKVDPKYYRRTVRYDTKEAPRTIIVDPGNYYVYR